MSSSPFLLGTTVLQAHFWTQESHFLQLLNCKLCFYFVSLRCKKCGISQKKYSNMIIERKKYLDMLIESQGNGLVKIITGGR